MHAHALHDRLGSSGTEHRRLASCVAAGHVREASQRLRCERRVERSMGLERSHHRHGASRRNDLLLHARRSERHIPQRPTALALHISVGHMRMHRVDDCIGAACIDDGLLVPDEYNQRSSEVIRGSQEAITPGGLYLMREAIREQSLAQSSTQSVAIRVYLCSPIATCPRASHPNLEAVHGARSAEVGT